MKTDSNGFIHIVAKPNIKTIYKSEKEDIKMKNDEIVTEEMSDDIINIIREFIEVRKSQFPNFSVVKNAKIEDAYMPVLKLKKKGYSDKVIIACIRIGMYNEFWKRNIMTLTQLNKKCKDELTKFEHLLMIYEEKNKNGNENKSNTPGEMSYQEL